MSRKTTFGSMLASFRFRKAQVVEKTRALLWERNKVPLHQQHPTDGYEIRDMSRVDRDGNTVIKFELWQRIDVERVKISSNISVETLEAEKGDEKEDDNWL